MKPNPFLVARQPQAKVRGHIVRSTSLEKSSALAADSDVFNFILDRIDRADLVTEGAIYETEEPRRFFGSAIFTLRRLSDAGFNTLQPSISLLSDPRFVRLMEARVYREILRHLGETAPSDFDWNGRESFDSGELRVYMDFECAVVHAEASKALVSR